MLKISDVTVKKLKANKFVKDLPEVYEMKNVVEDNPWHHKQIVFDHTLLVMEELKNVIANHPNIKHYLSNVIGSYSKEELLFIAALLHDISKKETMDKTGFSPFHEEKGAEKAAKILERFNLTFPEKKYILDIIAIHGKMHMFLINREEQKEGMLLEFKREVGKLFTELVVLTLADTIACDLRKNDPKEFEYKVKFYEDILRKV